ncbi:MAG: hypothetical protein GTO12_10605, partial [Proteobacteria bacterium]|nr:hypothetical protein [Pseudomonadota bacterium]
LMSDLQQAAHGMSAAAYQEAGGSTAAQSGYAGRQAATGADDDVVDAEFEEAR